MSFRGVLLRLDEAPGDESFRVVAPDAALVVPKASTTAADHRAVVSDAASGKLLSVVRLAAVSPRQALRSALWVATDALKDALSNSTGPHTAGTLEEDDASGATTAPASVRWPTVELAPPAAAARVCFCFYFRSDFEYELFARAAEAYVNAQRLALLRSSVLIELQVQRELDATSDEEIQAAANAAARALQRNGARAVGDFADARRSRARSGGHGRARDASTRPKPESKSGTQAVRPVGSRATVTAAAGSTITSPRYSRAELDATVTALKLERAHSGNAATDRTVARPGVPATGAAECIMCEFRPKPGTVAQLQDHPFVLQDGRGNKLRMCKICLQKVLQRRISVANGAALVASVAGLCNLCSQPTGQQSKKKFKQCAHEMCKNKYCASCVDKLVGKAQAQKIWRMKQWLCTNCTTFQDPAAVSSGAGSDTPDQQNIVEASRKNKKRRRSQAPSVDENTSPVLSVDATPTPSVEVTQAPLMTPVDYAASYFQFLVAREESNPPEEESEDVCFCCKDGGEVIECDWKGLSNKFARCPKVYHEDCLGYEVPEGKAWYCPRHRCHHCGSLADFHCRFCVTSYCEVHLPSDVPHLGPGSADVPNSTYVLCPRCAMHASDAVAEGKLPRDFYARAFCGAV